MRERPDIAVLRIGHEQQPVLVADAFTDDPDALRAMAATLDYSGADSQYPGVRAPVPRAYFDAVGPAIRHVMGDVLGIGGTARFTAAYFALATTPAEALSLPQRIPHIDSFRDNQLAIVHYLFADDQGGTAFFRHRATGYERVDRARHPHFMDSIAAEFAESGEPGAAYIAGSTDRFEQTARIDARYNRAIFYRGNMLHCAAFGPDCSFSADPLAGRLTVTAFVDVG